MTESERHELYELARSQISDRFAELMMNALPPEPERLSTKDDLAVLGSDLRTEMADLRAELKTEMADLRAELKTEMADLRTELKTEMAGLRTELKTEMAGLRTELRTEMADLRVEMRDLTNQQTRTLTLGLVGSITLLAITQMVLGVIG
jgi:F0F1-type ATP synthase membrane subunit b/b'